MALFPIVTNYSFVLKKIAKSEISYFVEKLKSLSIKKENIFRMLKDLYSLEISYN